MIIEEAIRAIVKNNMPLVCDFGTVTSVDEETFLCDIEIEGKSPVQDVRLFCGDYNSDAKGGGIVVVPEVGAQVLVIFFSTTVAFMLQCSKSKQIVFNGGENGGLIKIEELTKKINDLIDAFNQHTHSVATTGSAASQTGTAAVIVNSFTKLDKSSYEDKTIKH